MLSTVKRLKGLAMQAPPVTMNPVGTFITGTQDVLVVIGGDFVVL